MFAIESAYRIHFLYMSKDDAINIMSGSNLVDKRGVLYIFYYQENRAVILNRAKDYYENDKDRLREQARNKYRNLSEEEKNKKRQYGKNRYRNISEEKKQKLKD